MSRTLCIVCGAAAALLLGGCAAQRASGDSFFARITPYRIEIVQGNVVTSEQAARVRPGMSRAQVRDVLGTPLLTDPFHADRWDYLFTIRRQGLEAQRRSVVVRFEGDALKSIEAPDLPSEREFVETISVVRGKPRVPVLELTEEQRKALPPPRATPAAPTLAEPQGPGRSYPPLDNS